MQLVTAISELDVNKLDNFILNHSNANFFQSTLAYNFFRSIENYETFLFVACEDNEIVGSLLTVIISEGKGIKGYLTRRCIVWGGPLIIDNRSDVLTFLLKEFNAKISGKAIYSQFRNFFDIDFFKNIFQKEGFLFEEHLNINIDLSKSETELWKDVHTKRRNEIRRAEKEGTSFNILKNRSDLKETYNILKEVYKRAKLPLPGFVFFEQAYEYLSPDHFKVFIALNNEKIIGTMYTLCFGKIIYDWYAGSYQSFYKKYPNDLLPWKVFLWGKENGYSKFDFGGAGNPNQPYGVRDYKKKFGGKLKEFGRFIRINKPLLYQIGKLGLKILQKIK